jgi:hypothetical protein
MRPTRSAFNALLQFLFNTLERFTVIIFLFHT